MKLKTLLLGSAAAFAVVGGAQAADLSVAEPVDYVRVCDAMGVGYWYIPGTDTCLKIGGYVQFDVNIHDSTETLAGDWYYDSSSDSYYGTNHSASWDFKTEAGINVSAKSMTEYGILEGFIDLRASSNNTTTADHWGTPYYYGGYGDFGIYYSDHSDKVFRIDSAYLKLGALSAGYRSSTFDYGGGFSDKVYRSDTKTDQVRLEWAMGGFGIMLGIEDPRDRWGTALGFEYSMPDIIAAVTASQGNWDAKLSGGFADLYYGSVWGANLGITVKLDSIAPGDQFRINGAVGTGSSFVGGGSDYYTNWSAFASFQHFWSPTLSSAITGSYLNDGDDSNTWAVGGNLVWAPVSGFEASAQVYYIGYEGDGGEWKGRLRLKRSW
jgi:hypothetical protein